MSQATQSKPGLSKPGQGGRGRGAPVYGRGPPGTEASKPRRPRREPEEEVWVPKTILGQKVAAGEITSVEEILSYKPDGMFVSNGPGDPSAVQKAENAILQLSAKDIPILGICLVQHLIARAFGARTYKLPFGLHGG